MIVYCEGADRLTSSITESSLVTEFSFSINFLLFLHAIYTNIHEEKEEFPFIHVDRASLLPLEEFRKYLYEKWIQILHSAAETDTSKCLDYQCVFAENPIFEELFAPSKSGKTTFQYVKSFYKGWYHSCHIAYDLSAGELSADIYNKLASLTENVESKIKNKYHFFVTYTELPTELPMSYKSVIVLSMESMVKMAFSNSAQRILDYLDTSPS